MTGVEFVRELRKSMCGGNDDPMLGNRKLSIGRFVVEENRRATAEQVWKAYHREFDLDPERLAGAKPSDRQIMLEKREWLKNFMKKVDQIYTDGKFVPEKILELAQIPVEDRTEGMVVEKSAPNEEPEPDEKTVPGIADVEEGAEATPGVHEVSKGRPRKYV